MELQRRINMWVNAAADSIEELRGCDVGRVLDSAKLNGFLQETIVYVLEHRPELKKETDRYQQEA